MRLTTMTPATLAVLMMATTASAWHTCPKNAGTLVGQLFKLAFKTKFDAFFLNKKCKLLPYFQYREEKVDDLTHELSDYIKKDLVELLKENRELLVGHLSSIPFLQDVATGSMAVCLSQHNTDHGLSCLLSDPDFTDAITQIDDLSTKIASLIKLLEEKITKETASLVHKLKDAKDKLANLRKKVSEAKVAKLEKKCVREGKFYKGVKQLFDQAFSLFKRAIDLIKLCKMKKATRSFGAAEAPQAQPEAEVTALATQEGAEVDRAEQEVLQEVAEAEAQAQLPPEQREVAAGGAGAEEQQQTETEGTATATDQEEANANDEDDDSEA